MKNSEQRCKTENAFSIFFDPNESQKNLSRIFIEPPDESNTSCEESDGEAPVISFEKCEIVLRSGRRYKAETTLSQKANDHKSKTKKRGSKPLENPGNQKRQRITKRKSMTSVVKRLNTKECLESVINRKGGTPGKSKEAETKTITSAKNVNNFVRKVQCGSVFNLLRKLPHFGQI